MGRRPRDARSRTPARSLTGDLVQITQADSFAFQFEAESSCKNFWKCGNQKLEGCPQKASICTVASARLLGPYRRPRNSIPNSGELVRAGKHIDVSSEPENSVYAIRLRRLPYSCHSSSQAPSRVDVRFTCADFHLQINIQIF
jgi:hypothetical protein